MTEMSAGHNAAAQSSPDPAAGGTPSESDLPDLQGLPGVDEPSDEEGATFSAGGPTRPDSDAGSGSDPMPDIAGTGQG